MVNGWMDVVIQMLYRLKGISHNEIDNSFDWCRVIDGLFHVFFIKNEHIRASSVSNTYGSRQIFVAGKSLLQK